MRDEAPRRLCGPPSTNFIRDEAPGHSKLLSLQGVQVGQFWSHYTNQYKVNQGGTSEVLYLYFSGFAPLACSRCGNARHLRLKVFDSLVSVFSSKSYVPIQK
jgi:hypothetical protein